ncbi:hypothetical protein E2C01_033401 [Portunus trituberculatus]|uniref:Uncharacterized protein n=1 Tax=Portunus trituberculatus TaxID=210409 RepID=A0A5B7EXS3_PORTR|nr:hypothetical protein [Portunus trituberculatus]
MVYEIVLYQGQKWSRDRCRRYLPLNPYILLESLAAVTYPRLPSRMSTVEADVCQPRYLLFHSACKGIPCTDDPSYFLFFLNLVEADAAVFQKGPLELYSQWGHP